MESGPPRRRWPLSWPTSTPASWLPRPRRSPACSTSSSPTSHLGRSPSTLFGNGRLVAQLPNGFKALPLKSSPPKVVDDLYRLLGQTGNRKRATAWRNPQNALVFRLLAATGCRRGEAWALQWHDIDFASERWRVLIRRAVLDIEKTLIVQGTETHAVRNVATSCPAPTPGPPHRRRGLPSSER